MGRCVRRPVNLHLCTASHRNFKAGSQQQSVPRRPLFSHQQSVGGGASLRQRLDEIPWLLAGCARFRKKLTVHTLFVEQCLLRMWPGMCGSCLQRRARRRKVRSDLVAVDWSRFIFLRMPDSQSIDKRNHSRRVRCCFIRRSEERAARSRTDRRCTASQRRKHQCHGAPAAGSASDPAGSGCFAVESRWGHCRAIRRWMTKKGILTDSGYDGKPNRSPSMRNVLRAMFPVVFAVGVDWSYVSGRGRMSSHERPIGVTTGRCGQCAASADPKDRSGATQG